MRLHLAILRGAALLVPEQQRREWLAEWKSELWHAWQEPHGMNLLAFCFGSFRDALWLRRDGPVARSYGILHLEVPAFPSSFPEPPHTFLRSPAQCLSFLVGLAAVYTALAFALPWSRHVVLPVSDPDSSGLVMLAPAGYSAANANDLMGAYPSVSVAQFRSLKERTQGEFAGLGFYLPEYMGNFFIARTSRGVLELLKIPVPRDGDHPALLRCRTRPAVARFVCGCWRIRCGSDNRPGRSLNGMERNSSACRAMDFYTCRSRLRSGSRSSAGWISIRPGAAFSPDWQIKCLNFCEEKPQ